MSLYSRESIAWAAGLIEGEGSICKRKTGQVMIRVAMTDYDVLNTLQDTFDLGTITGPRRYSNSTKDVWEWTVYGFEKSQAVIAMIYPWLGKRRKEQAISLLTSE